MNKPLIIGGSVALGAAALYFLTRKATVAPLTPEEVAAKQFDLSQPLTQPTGPSTGEPLTSSESLAGVDGQPSLLGMLAALQAPAKPAAPKAVPNYARNYEDATIRATPHGQQLVRDLFGNYNNVPDLATVKGGPYIYASYELYPQRMYGTSLTNQPTGNDLMGTIVRSGSYAILPRKTMDQIILDPRGDRLDSATLYSISPSEMAAWLKDSIGHDDAGNAASNQENTVIIFAPPGL